MMLRIHLFKGGDTMRLDTQTMQTTQAANSRTLEAAVWRDLVRLAAEALAIGIAFSVLLALAVFMVARASNGVDGGLRADASPRAEARMV
jgi:hypothetical protein